LQDIFNPLDTLDNEEREDMEIGGENKGSLVIRGPDTGRLQVIFSRRSNEAHGGVLFSGLIDPEMQDNKEIMSIGYRGGSDPVEIYRTVPVEIAKLAAQYFFEHQSITNHGRYIWKGDVTPD
jgi:hypothetical protein